MKHNKEYFLIIGPARSGTTFIHNLLSNHPNVSILSDEISSNSVFFKKGVGLFTHGNHSEQEEKTGVNRIFKTLCDLNSLNKNVYASGSKIALQYADQAERVVNVINQNLNDFKIIIIKRDDLVAQYGSFLKSNLTGQSHSNLNIKTFIPLKKIKISRRYFRKYLQHQLWIIKYLDELKNNHNCIEINYEKEILNFNIETKKKIFSFLNIPIIEDIDSNLKKINSLPENYIINYSELSSFMQNYIKNYVLNKKPKKPMKNWYLLYKSFLHRKFKFFY